MNHILIYFDNAPIKPPIGLLKAPSGDGESFSSLPNMADFMSKEISWTDTGSTGLHNPVLSESTKLADNVQLTICTYVLWSKINQALYKRI